MDKDELFLDFLNNAIRGLLANPNLMSSEWVVGRGFEVATEALRVYEETLKAKKKRQPRT